MPLLAESHGENEPLALSRRIDQLRKAVSRMFPGICRQCQHLLRIRDVLFSNFYGVIHAPACASCLAKQLARQPSEFLAEITGVILDRDCYRTVWAEHEELPVMTSNASLTNSHSASPNEKSRIPSYHAYWDAGNLGCGDLVMALRGRLLAMHPGNCLRVTALDPAAPEDLPAWCRLTGHHLLAAQHPEYYIQRKEP